MRRILLHSKIHRATLTGAKLDYEGSIAVDARLIRAANMMPGEQVHVLNMSNGSRLVTYLIEAPAGSGTVLLNGPAARLGEKGDEVVILAYGWFDEVEARDHAPLRVMVGRDNRHFRIPNRKRRPPS